MFWEKNKNPSVKFFTLPFIASFINFRQVLFSKFKIRKLHKDIKKVNALDFFVGSTYDLQFIDWYPIIFIFILFGIFAIVFFIPDS